MQSLGTRSEAFVGRSTGEVRLSREVRRDITLRDLVITIRKHVILCLATVGICVLAAALTAVMMTPIYRAEILLFPVDHDSSASSLMRQFGGLATLAGLAPHSNKDIEFAIATLRSHAFAASFVERNSLASVLAPRHPGHLNFLRHHAPAAVPTVAAAAAFFLKKVERIQTDPDTGAVTLSIEFSDREKVATWANDIVTMINDQMRQSAIASSRLKLAFLNDELKKTNIVAVQQAIFNLIEGETKNIMLANTERDFVFRPVEQATTPAPGDYVRPNRVLLIAGGLLTGIALSVVLCLFVAAVAQGRDK